MPGLQRRQRRHRAVADRQRVGGHGRCAAARARAAGRSPPAASIRAAPGRTPSVDCCSSASAWASWPCAAEVSAVVRYSRALTIGRASPLPRARSLADFSSASASAGLPSTRSTTARLRRTSISPSSADCARGSVSNPSSGASELVAGGAVEARNGWPQVGGGFAFKRVFRHLHRVQRVGLGQQRQRLLQLALVHRVQPAIMQQARRRGRVGRAAAPACRPRSNKRVGFGEAAFVGKLQRQRHHRRRGVRIVLAEQFLLQRQGGAEGGFRRRRCCPPGWRGCPPSSAHRTARHRPS